MRERRGGLLHALLSELGGAIDDIRARTVEEGWFGRASGKASDLANGWTRPTVHDAGLPPRPSFEEAWAARPPGEAAPSHERSQDLDR